MVTPLVLGLRTQLTRRNTELAPLERTPRRRVDVLRGHLVPGIVVRRAVTECRVSSRGIVEAVDVVCDPGVCSDL